MIVSAVVLVTAALLCPARVLGGQIPIVDGIIGGVPSTSAPSEDFLTQGPGVGASAPTPGKLRVTENSGVCGASSPSLLLFDDDLEVVADGFGFGCCAETTPGVYQASGYGDISANESVWCVAFCAWRFEIEGSSC